MAYLRTGYHSDSFVKELRKESIRKACDLYWEHFPCSQSISLAFTGISGMAIGFSVADILDIPFAVIRKPNDGSHSSRRVEGYMNSKYVILDDFISSGDTITTIQREYTNQYMKDLMSKRGYPNPP